MAIVFYMTNYTTKVEDPVWKRAAAAVELFYIFGEVPAGEGQAENAYQPFANDGGHGNRTRQFLMRIANRVFIDWALS